MVRRLFAGGDGFELPVPRVLEPSQFIRLLDTAFAFRRRDRRRIGDRSHLPQAERIGWALPIAVGCTRVAFPVYPSVGPSNASRIFSSTVAPTNAFPWRKPDAIHRGYPQSPASD